MSKGWLNNIWIVLCIYLFAFSYSYAGDIVSTMTVQGNAYKVTYSEAKAFISRDGSEAVPVKSGTVINKPGIYFVSLYNAQNELVGIKQFVINAKANKDYWQVSSVSELEEIIKYSLENFTPTVTITFNKGSYNMTYMKKAFFDAIDNVLDKYPKLVYERSTITMKGIDRPTIILQIQYPLKVANTLRNYDLKTNAQIVEILNNTVEVGKKDYENEVKLYKYIVDNVTYSKTVVEGQEYLTAGPMTHNMYGALIDQIAVCDGYAKAFMYLMNAVGIPTRLIVGTADGVPHAWNLCKIQDSFYHTDVTWGDQDESEIGSYYDYLNENDNYMTETHVWDTEKYVKANTYAYNFLYMPININGLYRVKGKNDVSTVLSNLRYQNQGTIIFYNLDSEKWNERQLINQLVRAVSSDIYYTVEKKYNCLIINYRKS